LVGTSRPVSKFRNKISLAFADSILRPLDTMKYLGITLDPMLTFDNHCALVSSHFRLTARVIRHARSCLDTESANGISVALGNGCLDYGNSILSGVSLRNLDLLQRAQNSLARAVLMRPISASVTAMLQELHWLPLHDRIKFKLACFCFKIHSSQQPTYLIPALQDYVPARTLRSSDTMLLSIPFTRTTSARRRFGYSAPFIWNSLPAHLRLCTSYAVFRRQLKTHFFN
jgi:hypothetical protein